MANVDDLRNVVERLEAAYETAHERYARDMPHCLPEEVTDQNGRHILLDSLTAIVSARTALLNAEPR